MVYIAKKTRMRLVNTLTKPFFSVAVALLAALPFCADAQTLSWSAKTNMPVTGGTGRNMPYCLTIGSKIYVGGGNIAPGGTGSNEFYEYDTMTNVWTKKADLPGATDRSAGVAFSIGGKGYLGLGVSGYFGSASAYLADLWEYDPAANTWTAKASLPDTGRGGGVSCFVVNNKAYVVGGQITGAGLKTDEVYEYNPATNTWTAKAPFPGGAVTYPFVFASATKGYITAGSQGGAGSKKTYAYDPVANAWAPRADYPGGFTSGGVAFTLNNKSYCGLAGDDTIFAYNQATDAWDTAITNFPGAPRAYAVAVVVGSRAFVGCGWSFDASTSAQTFYQDWYRVFDSGASTSGVIQVVSRNAVSVWPNPATNHLFIHADAALQEGDATVYDLSGRKCKAQRWKTGESIDVSGLPAGMYTVSVVSPQATATTRFVIR